MSAHYIKLYFGDIHPASMFWGIMYLQLFYDTSCFFRWISFIQGCWFMCVEIIHHKDDLLGIRVHDVHQIPDFLCPVNGRTVFPYTDMMCPSKRFHESKYADRSITDIFGICFPIASRYHCQGFSGFSQKLVRFFIHTYDGTFFVIRKFINVKDIFHTGYEFRVFF